MTKTWYPVINYEECTECGACTEKCTHGVYDLDKAPRPVVINPEGCIEGCKGCGKLCPSGAIEYFGDTGNADEACCCGNTCDDDCGCKDGCDCDDDCGCKDGCDCDDDCGCGCK